MKVYSANEIRNIAILGHSGCGKTTTVEAALNLAGVTSRIGRVEEGNTVSDYDAEEIRRKVSIGASVIPVEWENVKINFIDAPGYFDFAGEVIQAVAAADLALIVVSAKSGVEVGCEKAWEFATEAGIPKIFFVNAMDDDNADLDRVIEDLKQNFGKSIAPLQVAFKEKGKFAGFIDVIKKTGRKFEGGKTVDCDIPEGLDGDVDNMRVMLEEAVAETDEALMEKFFEETRFTPEELQKGIRDGLLSGTVTPVICGSAALTVGISVMLHSIVKFVPAAKDARPEVKAKDAKTNADITVKCDEAEPFAAFVFKTIADPYVGRLSIFRVISGLLKRDNFIYNSITETSEKAGHIYIMRGKTQIEVNEIKCGDIGAIAKLTDTATNHTLCAKERPVIFEPIAFPPSLLSMAVVTKAKGDEDKISTAFAKLLEEDKTLKFEINKETKQSVVSGVGDNQLDVLVNKLKSKYKLDIELETPIVPYREMIKGKSAVQGKHKKQSGGHGQYGDVRMEFEPSGDQTQAYVFEEKVFGGSVPKQYFPAVEKGIQECVKAGPIAGYPVVGLKAILVDGSYHDVDSSEMAFKLATIIAFKDGFMKAKPTILEPIARVEVTVPDSYTGDIMGDLSKRRGRISGQEKTGNKLTIQADVPMAEMFKYATDLRSITQGRGSFTMVFDRYEEAPNDVQQKVIAARAKENG